MSITRLCTLVLAILSCCSYAQTTWPSPNATWYYDAGYTGIPISNFYTASTTGDTVLAGRQARVVTYSDGREAYFRNSGDAYYFYHDTAYYPYFNFSLPVGDTGTYYIYDVVYDQPTQLLDTVVIARQIRHDSTQPRILTSGDTLWKYYCSDVSDSVAGTFYPLTYNPLSGYEGTTIVPFVSMAMVGTPPFMRCYEDNQLAYKTEQWENSGLACDFRDPANVDELTSRPILRVFPNPVRYYVRITLSRAERIRHVRLYSSTGQLLLDTVEPELYVGHLPNGTYLLTIHTDKEVYSQSVFKIDY